MLRGGEGLRNYLPYLTANREYYKNAELLEPKWLEPKWLERKWLEPKWLEPKWLELK